MIYTKNNIKELEQILYDSQFKHSDISNFINETLTLNIKRPDFERYKHTKFFFIKKTIVFQTNSVLSIKGVVDMKVEKSVGGHFNDNSHHTIYDFFVEDDALTIHTEYMKLYLKLRGGFTIELDDVEKTNKTYLRIAGWKEF